jgi:geranylgeranyl diphosphate synthase type II
VSEAGRSFADYVAGQRARVDEALARFLPSDAACPSVIADAMRYSVMAGGKRLRPVLTLASAEAMAWSPRGSDADLMRRAAERALPCACAIELIHTYSLVHDDLPAMDNDTLRRGRPTLHVVHGEGMAILAGDGLLADAFALLVREPQAEGDSELALRKLRVIGVIAEAAGSAGMVGGQALDLQAANRDGMDGPSLQAMHARKTGALIRAAATSGAIMGGGAADQVTALDRYAARLGLAFQIVDDILDVEGLPGELGKTAGKDAASGKPTYPSVYGLDASRRLAHETLESARTALSDARLEYPPLLELAEWVGSRRN